MSRWVGSRGFEVEAIRLDGRALLRVRQYGFLVAYCGSVTEVARHVDLDDLVELIPFPPGTAW
ncbi:transposase [Sphaerisporangium fuscum]|uniref:transposase n=1 Tax=Sphaerisporangium fuscum TaxID=2835868 RepID=UPI001BDDB280|nr:transposase [Sphaerisporangium fuscum]